ncbi:MAG TPA: cytochrome c, partial [Rhizomicrobium sp.]|nr:cytochrome c [Rhizomicrobium sp.]
MIRSVKFLDVRFLGAAALIALGASSPVFAQGQGIFTLEQAHAGHGDYAAKCGGCHRANLAGGGDAPALGGSGFMSSFGGRTTKQLYDFIYNSMPAGAPKSLSEEQYTNITAYLLWANGARPGATPLNRTVAVRISTIANGAILPEAIASPAPGKMSALESRADLMAPPFTLGQTVKGTVKNYVDVTDEMLKHPDDGEWPMYR